MVDLKSTPLRGLKRVLHVHVVLSFGQVIFEHEDSILQLSKVDIDILTIHIIAMNIEWF